MSKQARHFYEFGRFRLDCDDRVLMLNGEPVEITPQALELLVALLEKQGRVVTKQELSERIWSGTTVGENSLPQAVAALRRSLHRDPAVGDYVETIPKRGYRLLPQVREVKDLETPQPRATESPLGNL